MDVDTPDRGGGAPSGESRVASYPPGEIALLSPQGGFFSLLFSSFLGGLSPAEACFLQGGVADGVRGDGRGLCQTRPWRLACNLLMLSCSSAALEAAENSVVVTVDADLVLPGSTRFQDPYRLTVCCGAAEEELGDITGGDCATLSSLLKAMLEQLLLSHLHPVKEESGAFWSFSIDVIVLRAGGCLLDAVSLAIWGALRTLRIPNVIVEEPEETEQGLAVGDARLSCDPRVSLGKPYNIETVPLILTAAQIGQHYLWDLTEAEAACAASFLVAAFLPSGACVGLQKFGNVLCDCRTLQSTLATSQRLSREIFADLEAQVVRGAPETIDSFFTLASF